MNDEINSISGPGVDVPVIKEAHNLGIQAWENEGGAIVGVHSKKGTPISNADDLNGDSVGK
jgi:hypothetical protein